MRLNVCSFRFENDDINTCGGFLIRRSSAFRKFFAEFLTCDYRMIIKAFLKKLHYDFAKKFAKISHENVATNNVNFQITYNKKMES